MSSDTEANDALKLLLKTWGLEFPKLLISVTGGAKSFKLNPKLKQLFSDGLSKVNGFVCFKHSVHFLEILKKYPEKPAFLNSVNTRRSRKNLLNCVENIWLTISLILLENN